MGLFGKLFAKKPAPPAPQKPDEIYFDSPFCRFFYEASPGANEYGYEGEIKRPDGQQPLWVYIDTDAPETTDAVQTYARLEQLLNDADIDHDTKIQVAEHFVNRPGFTDGTKTVPELADKMDIWDISVYRNGEVHLGVEAHLIYADDIKVILQPDGGRRIRYVNFNNEHYDEPLC